MNKNTKSNSKVVLNTKFKVKAPLDTTGLGSNLKRFKSQENYLSKEKKIDSHNINNEINQTSSNISNPFNLFLNKSKEFNTKKNNSNSAVKDNENRSILSPESNKIQSKIKTFVKCKPVNNSKLPHVSKILNDESIQELNTEENILSSEEDEEDMQTDETKSSEAIIGFYTNSTCEAPHSILNKNKMLINNLPQPVMKVLKNKFAEEKEKEINSKYNLESLKKNKNNSSSSKKIDKNENEIPNLINVTHNITSDVINSTSRVLYSETNLNKKINLIQIKDISASPKNNKSEDKSTTKSKISEKTLNEINKIITPINKNSGNLESTQRKFLICAKKGDRETFLESLEYILNDAKGDINFKDESGWSALHYACDEGNLKIVDILINTNVDVNVRTNNKKSALHLATSHGYFDISKILVESGCVINSLDDEKNTPIHTCASIGHIELLKYLLDRLPQADAKNIYGKTPLDLAKKDDIKSLLGEYLKKNEVQYHKVLIHTTNNKSANVLIKNLNSSMEKIGNYITGNQNIKTPVKNVNHNQNLVNIANNSNNKNNIKNKYETGNLINSNKVNHIKLQSNDFNQKVSNFQNNNNNINININTSLNNPKVKVTVETKVDNSNSSLKGNPNNSSTITNNKTTANNSKLLTHASTTVKFNTTPNQLLKNFQKSHSKNIFNGPNKFTNLNSAEKTSRIKEIKINTNENIFNKENLLSPKRDSTKAKLNISTTQKHVNSIEIINKEIENKEKLEYNIQKINESFNLENSQFLKVNNTNDTYKSSGNSIDNSASNDEDRIGPSSFVCHALIGKGSFGEVYLVEKINTKTFYAMKVLSKDKIMAQNLVKYAMTERNVLSITNHPFIVKLNFSFQTSDKLFLILDYCQGGDLAEHLARENRFTEERAKIYLCEIILALEDLHKRDIIFRDLKPDNVVLDCDGHACLTDFGLSKEGVLDGKSAKSFCGSIAYLAPEMLKRSGHGKAVDWYLLGVLFYEMLVGIPPYFTNNKEQLFKNIEKAELQIPKFVSSEAADLLRSLLQRDPIYRLGANKLDAVEVKKSKYFDDVNWSEVYDRKLKPPIPSKRNRLLQQFNRPRMIEDNGCPGALFLDSQLDSHFDGWSFINTEENQLTSPK